MVFKYDFLIIGAGVAGMSYALKVARAHKGKVCMICKTSLDEANTSFAQGGVASVTNLAVDNFDKHIEDTMIAGDFISDRRAVRHCKCNYWICHNICSSSFLYKFIYSLVSASTTFGNSIK